MLDFVEKTNVVYYGFLLSYIAELHEGEDQFAQVEVYRDLRKLFNIENLFDGEMTYRWISLENISSRIEEYNEEYEELGEGYDFPYIAEITKLIKSGDLPDGFYLLIR